MERNDRDRATLLKRWEKAEATVLAAQNKELLLREDLAKDCQHEKSSLYFWTHSDGHGRHTQKPGLRCFFCQAAQFYMDGNWTKPEDISEWAD